MSQRDDSVRGDEDPRAPLWATVLADLRLRLADGEFEERFPTDRELTACYGVSRHTVREAVRRLEMVDRRPRVGGKIRRPPGALENLGRSLTALGVDLVVTPTGAGPRAGGEIGVALGAGPRRRLAVLSHVLYADRQPLAMSELWLCPASPLGAADVDALFGLRPGDARISIEADSVLPMVAAAEVATALHLPDGAAVFCADQRLDVDGRPAAWHRVFIRPERYRCIVRWDPGAAGS
jgi:GntR family transcriptional regulator